MEYDRIINEQNNLGIIERVAKISEAGVSHYLPHRPVIRNDKSSTKVRMVFDASASKTDTPSLNDCLYTGPSLTPLLFDVLIRLRAYKYVVLGDIEKAFLQISLSPDHRDFVRFLWFECIDNLDFTCIDNNDLAEYRLCRVLFGVASSPFLLTATLIKNAIVYENFDPEFVYKLLESLHVDDLISGANNIHDAFEFYVKCKERLKNGGFNLRKFKSNSVELEKLVYEAFPEDCLYSDENKILGLLWDKNTDAIIFDFKEIFSKFVVNPTKRSILQSIASIYDPLGLINPLTVRMKIIFQDICSEKFGWDDELSEKFRIEWNIILSDLKRIDCIRVQRNYCFLEITDQIISVQVHAFSDASKRLYAASVYLRFQLKTGIIQTVLLTSKSRILSAKKIVTIPKAELLGVLLMTEICTAVIKSLSSVYTLDKIYYWTDSTIVYCWVLNYKKKYDSYVQKRLEKIRSILHHPYCNELKLVPSKSNPADIGTRGVSPKNLSNSDLWFQGPKFLLLSELGWPNLSAGDKFDAYNENNCNTVYGDSCLSRVVDNINASYANGSSTCLLGTADNNVIENNDACLSSIIDINKFSSLIKLLRVTAYVIKFIKILKKKLQNTEDESVLKNNTEEINVTGEDIRNAKILWIKDVQTVMMTDKRFNNWKLQLCGTSICEKYLYRKH